MRAVPRLDLEAEVAGRRPRLKEIVGLVPALTREIPGCAFAPRCELASDRCRTERPAFAEAEPQHRVACFEWAKTLETSP